MFCSPSCNRHVKWQPHYVPSILQTTDGRLWQGLSLGYERDGQREQFLASDGTTFLLNPADVESRRMSTTSIMPDDLFRQLTDNEIRNLLALLEHLD